MNMTGNKTVDVRHNNFDFLRFAAASLVLFSHCYPLTGRNAEEPISAFTGYASGGTWAVSTFFVISGYLICGSYINSSSWRSYLWKRALRLFPALAVATLFGAFIVGTLTTKLDLGAYFTHAQTWDYLKNIVLNTRYYLPGVFTDNVYPNAVNGSLWTLPVEASMYLILMVLGLTKLLTRRYILFVLLAFLVFHYKLVDMLQIRLSVALGTIQFFYFFKLGVFFFLGSTLYLYRDYIPMRVDLFAFLGVLLLVTFKTPVGPFVMQLALPYLVIYFAQMRTRWLWQFGRYGDFSYGIYVFAFPMQQLVIYQIGADIPIWEFVILAYIPTVTLAVISWHLVENPALKLKKRQIDLGLVAGRFSFKTEKGLKSAKVPDGSIVSINKND